jgi:putative flavoprotein involved in K+ transport
MNRVGSERLETVIIGGGQAGLAVGYHLGRRGRRFVILEANDRVGLSWRTRWNSLRLFTPAQYNGLPGMAFPAPRHSLPTKDEVADYLDVYATRFHLPVMTGVRVDGLSRVGGLFIVKSGNRRFECDNVVVATGAYQTPRVPSFAPDLDPDILQLHSSQYRSPSQLREGGVLVVGAANSGAEIALDVCGHHETWLSGRDVGVEAPWRIGGFIDRFVIPLVWFLFSHVLTTKTSIGRRLRDKLRSMGLPLARVKPKDFAPAGVERVQRTVAVQDGFPQLPDGRVLRVSNVIWCTGFRPDFKWIDLPIVDEDGYPQHERGVVTSQPGLYFVGLFFLNSPTSSLIGGVGRDAEHIAQHLAARESQEGTTSEVLSAPAS